MRFAVPSLLLHAAVCAMNVFSCVWVSVCVCVSERGKASLSVFLCIYTFFKALAVSRAFAVLKTSVARSFTLNLPLPHSDLKFYMCNLNDGCILLRSVTFAETIPFYFSKKGFPGLAIALVRTGCSLMALFSLTLFAPSSKERHPFHIVSIEAITHF